ncbi:hypothetical protein K1719_016418 [Acacia pycnantha]|nr:hypothetical protein K1719_016418 [Acacia pycnantha]
MRLCFGTSSCKAFPRSIYILRGSWTTTSCQCRSEPVFFRNDAAREFFSLMDKSDRPLYQGCQKYSKLSFLIKLYHIKCMCGITDKAMSMFLELLRDAFPDADIPSSFYEAKKIIND